MKMIEDLKEDINNPPKDIHENIGRQVEAQLNVAPLIPSTHPVLVP